MGNFFRNLAEDVHDVVACFAVASGCNFEEIDSIKTLTHSVDLAAMRLVCERNSLPIGSWGLGTQPWSYPTCIESQPFREATTVQNDTRGGILDHSWILVARVTHADTVLEYSSGKQIDMPPCMTQTAEMYTPTPPHH
jgi:hypothetical protein